MCSIGIRVWSDSVWYVVIGYNVVGWFSSFLDNCFELSFISGWNQERGPKCQWLRAHCGDTWGLVSEYHADKRRWSCFLWHDDVTKSGCLGLSSTKSRVSFPRYRHIRSVWTSHFIHFIKQSHSFCGPVANFLTTNWFFIFNQEFSQASDTASVQHNEPKL